MLSHDSVLFNIARSHVSTHNEPHRFYELLNVVFSGFLHQHLSTMPIEIFASLFQKRFHTNLELLSEKPNVFV
jgi:hypothetical protein